MRSVQNRHCRAMVLLPLVLLVFLGVIVLMLGLRNESFREDLKTINPQILWLDLHLLSFKEQLKSELQSANLKADSFTTFSLVIAEDFHYTAVVKKMEEDLEQKGVVESFYFVDIFGIYRDSHKEFLQEFSTRRAFILRLQ
ncbi:hypothetical protein [Helicobacter sp. MIT 05-5294]|uniref:hypothetical protein n=1 Tax=Helicobacter sp. MIT 05-5294 TaxID=1548150 RepID=UPI00051F90C0|nr:hypothetical protein [Helicobacter sp. MIT 05-5294]TLD85431.1 hypothetical protein LS69_009575 [Helicobacter sp. MIT 05-5294]